MTFFARLWAWVRGVEYHVEVWTDKGWAPFAEVAGPFLSEDDAIAEACRVWLNPLNYNHTWRVTKRVP